MLYGSPSYVGCGDILVVLAYWLCWLSGYFCRIVLLAILALCLSWLAWLPSYAVYACYPAVLAILFGSAMLVVLPSLLYIVCCLAGYAESEGWICCLCWVW
jgi:hypothetical protein